MESGSGLGYTLKEFISTLDKKLNPEYANKFQELKDAVINYSHIKEKYGLKLKGEAINNLSSRDVKNAKDKMKKLFFEIFGVEFPSL